MSRPSTILACAVMIGIAVAYSLSGCSGGGVGPVGRPPDRDAGGSAPSFECTPTAPNGLAPPGEAPSESFYGNGELWTVLWPDGEVVFEPGGAGEIRPDGSLAMKFPFWRGENAHGRLTIDGRSLHRPGLRVTAEIPDGYGDQGFQATALVFPEAGCWEVTASSGDARLTFVTRVVLRQ